jgi:hypothetical protein
MKEPNWSSWDSGIQWHNLKIMRTYLVQKKFMICVWNLHFSSSSFIECDPEIICSYSCFFDLHLPWSIYIYTYLCPPKNILSTIYVSNQHVTSYKINSNYDDVVVDDDNLISFKIYIIFIKLYPTKFSQMSMLLKVN